MALPLVSSTMNKSINAIELYRGQSRNVEVDIVETVTEHGVTFDRAADLTDAVVYFTAKKLAGYPVPLLSKNSTTAGIQISSPPTLGKAVVKILSDDTKFMPSGSYVYDIWVVFPDGRSLPVVELVEFKIKDSATMV